MVSNSGCKHFLYQHPWGIESSGSKAVLVYREATWQLGCAFVGFVIGHIVWNWVFDDDAQWWAEHFSRMPFDEGLDYLHSRYDFFIVKLTGALLGFITAPLWCELFEKTESSDH